MSVEDAVLLIFSGITIIWFVATLIGRAKELARKILKKGIIRFTIDIKCITKN